MADQGEITSTQVATAKIIQNRQDSHNTVCADTHAFM